MDFTINKYKYTVSINNFPTGEMGVILPTSLPQHADTITVYYDWVRWGNSGVIVLAQLLEALQQRYRSDTYKKNLVLPYVPYSRQDRVCNKGESFSLKIFANIINQFNFDLVQTWDNHSDVATALIDNCVDKSQAQILVGTELSVAIRKGEIVLVSPDNGAIKKTRSIAKAHGGELIVRCDKKRDISTGQIVLTEVFDRELVRRLDHLLIVDDICDGGGTFLGLASKLKELNPTIKLDLYITHGFFTKGIDILLEVYDNIYTTDSVCRISDDKLTIIGDK